MLVVCLAASTSGALLGLAFASNELGAIGWIALVPLLAVLPTSRPLEAAAAGLLFGGVGGATVFGWLFAVPGFGLLQFAPLAVYTALYPACWCVGVQRLSLGRSAALLPLTAAAGWVALDLLRSHAGFLALPWATLGQSQHANLPLLQIASVGGEAAVTFMVVMGNAVVASLWRGAAARELWLPAGAVAAAHAMGAIALFEVPGGAPIMLAAVQPAIALGERDTAAGREAIWQRLDRLTREAARVAPALIVWPETAIGDPHSDARLGARLAALSASIGAPLIVGAAETDKFAPPSSSGMTLAESERFNSAFLVVGGALVGSPYRKRVLLPFAEYLPWRGIVPWPAALVPEVTDGVAGADDAFFELMRGDLRVATTICWESEFAHLSRDAVNGGARVLVQLTNDAWFGDTRASAQHNMASVLRAVENRVPVVIASNAGPSQVIDSRGRVQAAVHGIGRQGVVVAVVATGAGGTWYGRCGDLFAQACVAFVALGLVRAGRSSLAGSRSPSPRFAKETP